VAKQFWDKLKCHRQNWAGSETRDDVEMDLASILWLCGRYSLSTFYLSSYIVLAQVTLFPVNIFSFEVKVWDFGTSWGNLWLYLSGMKGGRKAVIFDIKGLEHLG
jgi:hypothetical protein